MAVAPPRPAPPPPPPRGPRISQDLADYPTQRLYLFALFILLQSFKLSDFFFPSSSPSSTSPTLVALDDVLLNTRLLKWFALDLVFIGLVSWLRVPRFDWSWKGLWLGRLALFLLDYGLFGGWTWGASLLVPGFLKGLLATYLSTAERSVRLSTVFGTEQSHLGGQYTVHILATSTAHLNPASACYCLPANGKHEPIHIPLILNNTSPSKVTYTLTSFASPATSQLVTVPGSALITHHSLTADAASSDDDDVLADWALIPSTPSSSSAPRHRLPTTVRDPSDPFDLSPTEKLYYLPVPSIGSVRLESVLDAEGLPVRIRRKRSPEDETRILQCPRAGFEQRVSSQETHRCLSSGVPESWSLELVVSGQAPLSVKWHTVGVDGKRGPQEVLDGIVSPTTPQGEKYDGHVRVPMNVSLAKPGRTAFFLDSVVDGCGNAISYNTLDVAADSTPTNSKKGRKSVLPGHLDSRSVVVHRPPEVAFTGACGRGEDVRLLQGKTSTLEIRLSGVEHELEERRRSKQHSSKGRDELWTVTIRFSPESGNPWEREIQSSLPFIRLDVQEAGRYEIVNIKSKWCDGTVLVPNSCTVVSQPLPTLQTSFQPLLDSCKSEIGLISTLHLTGTPPFTVHYTTTQHIPGQRPRTSPFKKRVHHSRDEIRFEPGPGEWEYNFVKLEDRWYDAVELPHQHDATFKRKQVVQLVGDAKWRAAKTKKVVHSCEGETVQVEVDLKGTSPWDLEYSVVGQPSQTIRGITTSRHKIDIDIPALIAQRGGQFSLSLESVKDAHGCPRALTGDDLVVEVQRTKPTARFHGIESARSVVIRENDRAKIPLRLTGEGPWTVTYRPPPLADKPNSPLSPQTFEATAQNVDIDLVNPRPGLYELLSVHDSHCPGDVTETDWTISTLPRPTLRIAQSAGTVARNGSVIRAAVCENAVDVVSFALDGKAPFKASYKLAKGSHQADAVPRTLASIQSRADLTLFTAVAGHHTYTFTGVGDFLYTTPSDKGLIAPEGGRHGVVRLEQDVFPLPSAAFLHGPKRGFCVNDPLASRTADDLILRLEGTAPFEVELEVREDGHRQAKRFTIPNIRTKEWPVVLPFDLTTPSAHSITLRRVSDAHGCERIIDAVATPSTASVIVPVAEIATIAPVLPQTEHCVGDFLEYVVQGAPPFTVKYEFEGKKHAVPLSSSKFSRLAAKPGTFKIVSVGHGDDECRANTVDLTKRIHPIPTARVSEGDSVIVDLREGDQTEIVFTFEGTPPFAFTYSRRKPQDRSKDRTVLETHTVTGIESHTWSLFTSQEGTWSVSYISDAHCSYPPAKSVDSSVVKA